MVGVGGVVRTPVDVIRRVLRALDDLVASTARSSRRGG
jgi:hypothetical protein